MMIMMVVTVKRGTYILGVTNVPVILHRIVTAAWCMTFIWLSREHKHDKRKRYNYGRVL